MSLESQRNHHIWESSVRWVTVSNLPAGSWAYHHCSEFISQGTYPLFIPGHITQFIRVVMGVWCFFHRRLRGGGRSQCLWQEKENIGQGKARRPVALAGPQHVHCAVPVQLLQAACRENCHEGGRRSRTTSCRNMNMCLPESGHEYSRRGCILGSTDHPLITFQPLTVVWIIVSPTPCPALNSQHPMWWY